MFFPAARSGVRGQSLTRVQNILVRALRPATSSMCQPSNREAATEERNWLLSQETRFGRRWLLDASASSPKSFLPPALALFRASLTSVVWPTGSETHCTNYQPTINGALSAESRCLLARQDRSAVNTQGNQVRDKNRPPVKLATPAGSGGGSSADSSSTQQKGSSIHMLQIKMQK